MKITFNQAQKALGHLNKKRHPNGAEEKPPLLGLKGKDRALKIYQLKTDLNTAFEACIERFRDLSSEGREFIQKRQKLQQSDGDNAEEIQELTGQISEIEKEIEEIFQEEKEVTLQSGKLTTDEIGEVLDADLLEDLEFAINLNGKDNEEV